MPRPSYWLPFKTAKAVLVLLFKRATQRVAQQTEHVAKLSNERIEAATEQLNQVADDIRDAPEAAEESPMFSPSRRQTDAVPIQIPQLRK